MAFWLLCYASVNRGDKNTFALFYTIESSDGDFINAKHYLNVKYQILIF